MGYSYEQELRELRDEHHRRLVEEGHSVARMSDEHEKRLRRIRELKRLIEECEQ